MESILLLVFVLWAIILLTGKTNNTTNGHYNDTSIGTTYVDGGIPPCDSHSCPSADCGDVGGGGDCGCD